VTGAASIARALALTLSKADLDDRSAAAVALSKRYATLLDAAAARGTYRRPLALLAKAAALAGDDETLEAYAKIADALGQHSVASDLGPKLLASLAALGLTAPVTGKDQRRGSPAGAVRDELRARRGARAGRTTAVDTATS
jgi:hypothetical protein